MSLDAAVEKAVAAALEKALGPYLRRLSDPEPLVYSVRETAHVLRTSTTTETDPEHRGPGGERTLE